MKYLLALLSALFLVAASGTLIDSGYPPLKYQHNTTAQTIIFATPSDINGKWCEKAKTGYTTLACTYTATDQHMVLPNPCGAQFLGQSFARIACHEMGHLNGWPADHPRP